MTSGQKFCTECGSPLVPGSRFCGQCGHPVAGLATTGPPVGILQQQRVQPEVPGSGGPERILGIVPFLEQGLISVVHYTLLVTSHRLIFCTWNPDSDEAMSDADDEVMEESCNIAETVDEISHFRAKDWSMGPWQRYLTMPTEIIAAGSPGTITIMIHEISDIEIVCETKKSTQDQLHIHQGDNTQSFDLMYSQGPFLFRILEPLLGEKVRMSDHLHRRSKIDRLLTGQEYK